MSSDQKIKVGILRGGKEPHFDFSLNKSKHIIAHINKNLSNKYKIVDILIDKNNVWHCNGIPIAPNDLMNKVDVVWNTSHSNFSNILSSLAIPNIGISSFYNMLENNRDILRRYVKEIGLNVPRFIIAPKNAREVFEKFGSPWIIKNSNEIRVIKTFNELEEVITNNKDLIIEEFIEGKVVSVHSLLNFRGQNFYTFPLGDSYGSFSTPEKEKLINLAKELYSYLGARHYLKSDFVLNQRGKVYLLNINGTPDLVEDSHLSRVSRSVGVEIHHIIDHILGTCFKK